MPNGFVFDSRLRAVVLFALAAIAVGCASTNVTGKSSTAPDFVPRPDRVLVYDVTVTPDQIPADSSLNPYIVPRDVAQTPAEIELGRRLGGQIGMELTKRLVEIGLPAVRATGPNTQERANDLVIRSGFVVIDEGSMAKRAFIGFGAGSNELQTHFDVYRVTPDGREPLGTAGIKAAGGYMPGILLSMGIGGIVKGLAIGGGLAAGREFTSESIQGAAERTAKEFVKEVKPGLVKRGWIKDD